MIKSLSKLLLIFAIPPFFMGTEVSMSETNKFSRFDAIFQRNALEQNIDWRWLKTFAMKESSLGTNPRVARGLVNPKDVAGSISEDKKSWGLMQLTLATASALAKRKVTAEELNNPEFSIKLSAQYIGILNKKYKGNIRDIVMAYNQGETNQNKFIKMEKSRLLLPFQFSMAKEYYRKWLKAAEFLINEGEITNFLK